MSKEIELDIPVFDLENVETNKQEIGNSIVSCPIDLGGRKLTAGEKQMAEDIFKDAIKYEKVRIHSHIWSNFQDNNVIATTPDHNIYFNKYYKDDFSDTSVRPVHKVLFIHEMTHVWQSELGFSNKLRGFWYAVTGQYSDKEKEHKLYHYNPETDAGKKLQDFGMEQQGTLIGDYYSQKHLNGLGISKSRGTLSFLQEVLKEFINNPKNTALLP